MRFVAVKPVAAQADAMLFRTRALLVRQRTQTINSLRGQLAEFGMIAAQGAAGVAVMRLELAEVEGRFPNRSCRWPNCYSSRLPLSMSRSPALRRRSVPGPGRART